MNLITRDQLRAKLDRGDAFKLVMTLPELAYRAKHIPTSLHFDTVEETFAGLDTDEEIVVYCADVHCRASIYAYHSLERAGYTRVRRYAGGIADWEAAGYRLEHGSPVRRKIDRPVWPTSPPAPAESSPSESTTSDSLSSWRE